MADTAPKPDPPEPGYTQEDWDDVSDTPALSESEFADLRPARLVPEIFALLPKRGRGRGRPKRADAKVNLTLRVEPALIEAYKATGPGWQVRMQEALAVHLRSGSANSVERAPKPQRVTRSVRKVGPTSA